MSASAEVLWQKSLRRAREEIAPTHLTPSEPLVRLDGREREVSHLLEKLRLEHAARSQAHLWQAMTVSHDAMTVSCCAGLHTTARHSSAVLGRPPDAPQPASPRSSLRLLSMTWGLRLHHRSELEYEHAVLMDESHSSLYGVEQVKAQLEQLRDQLDVSEGACAVLEAERRDAVQCIASLEKVWALHISYTQSHPITHPTADAISPHTTTRHSPSASKQTRPPPKRISLPPGPIYPHSIPTHSTHPYPTAPRPRPRPTQPKPYHHSRTPSHLIHPNPMPTIPAPTQPAQPRPNLT